MIRTVKVGAEEADYADLGDRAVSLSCGRGESALWLSVSLEQDHTSVVPRADFAEQLALERGQFPTGLRWTLHQGGVARHHILGVGGLEPLGNRRWGAWAYLSDLTPRQWGFAAMAAARVLKWAWRRGATIQAVPAPTPQAVRLLKRIGFADVGEPYMVWEG